MSDIDELKKRATAAEFTLIEATVKAVQEQVVRETRTCAINFIRSNPIDFRRIEYEREEMSRWMDHFVSALQIPETK